MHLWTCWCGCVCRAVILRAERKRKDRDERRGRKMGIKRGRHVAMQPRERKKERKKWKFSRWWTVRDRSMFPSAWLSAQSQSIQYRSVQRSILVYNNMLSLWSSYRWQALINTGLWSVRTLDIRLFVQCYLVVTLVTYFKCHVPARLVGHHGWWWQRRRQFHGTNTATQSLWVEPYCD